jgi:hypothetical protein
MQTLNNEERWTARGLILALDWEDEALLGRKAYQWVMENLPRVEQVKWGQWEGLRRCGESARTWMEFSQAVEDWICEPTKGSQAGRDEKRVARRAWKLEPLRAGQPALKESLMGMIEEASRPPDTEAISGLRRLLDRGGFTEVEKNEIDQTQRVRRARRFVELLTLCIRLRQKEAEQCWASIF